MREQHIAAIAVVVVLLIVGFTAYATVTSKVIDCYVEANQGHASAWARTNGLLDRRLDVFDTVAEAKAFAASKCPVGAHL